MSNARDGKSDQLQTLQDENRVLKQRIVRLEESRRRLEVMADNQRNLFKRVNEEYAELSASLKSKNQELLEYSDRLESSMDEIRQVNCALEKEISQRKATQDELRRSMEQLQGILDHSPNLIYLKDKSGKYIFANECCRAYFSHCFRKGFPLSHNDVFDKEEVAAIQKLDEQVFQTGEPVTLEQRLTLRQGPHVFLTCKFPLRDNKGEIWGLCGIATDITKAKQLQEEASRAARLAALGELAAGVAHEVNNPINGIINLAQVLIDSLESEVDQRFSRQIISEAERIATIVKSLLSFARKPQRSFPRNDIGQILTETLQLARTQIESQGIILSVDLQEDLPPVRANFQEIQQVFLNILYNARDSLLKRTDAYERRIDISSAPGPDPSMVRIVFRDTGPGMDNETLAKVFEPFFTTKPRTEGTGLGLSLSHRLIKQHQGNIFARSVENEFTEMVVELPRFSKE